MAHHARRSHIYRRHDARPLQLLLLLLLLMRRRRRGVTSLSRDRNRQSCHCRLSRL